MKVLSLYLFSGRREKDQKNCRKPNENSSAWLLAQRGQSLKIRQLLVTLAKLQRRSAKTSSDTSGIIVEVHFKSGDAFPEIIQFIRSW